MDTANLIVKLFVYKKYDIGEIRERSDDIWRDDTVQIHINHGKTGVILRKATIYSKRRYSEGLYMVNRLYLCFCGRLFWDTKMEEEGLPYFG